LGSAIYWSAFANFEGAQKLNVFYPVALAEKISGKELNGNESEIFANFSSGINWYYGTSGTPAANQFDFVTVVLHEIGHGLGFSGSFSVDGTSGEVGAFDTAIPIVYDAAVENGSGAKLLQNFNSPSGALRSQLVSNNLRINIQKNSTGSASLYAPSVFDAGSSISHLDESSYPANNENALMTPQIGFGEANHNPGPLAFGILSDLGWEMVRMDHQPYPNTETETGPFTVSVKLINDDEIQFDTNQVKLHYTSNGTNFVTIDMMDVGNAVFTADIPTPPSIPWSYGYFISVGDNAGRTVLNPGKITTVGASETQNLFVFEIGPDNVPPKIIHTPISFLKEDDTQLEVQAMISDNIGIASASIEYRLNDGPPQTLALSLSEPQEDSVYVAILDFGLLADGDVIHYTLTAIDNSNVPKTTVSDAFSVAVFGFAAAVNTYNNTFNSASNDLFGTGFNVSTPAGFSSGAIHTIHPYPEGDPYPNNEIEFSYVLKYPITVNADNSYLRFDEIVLVEPGETGSVFGDPEFYDYVVVEGSKDLGTTWKALTEGYDSRAQSSWLNRYNSAFSGNNSTATGIPSLYKPRVIDLQNAFNAGDEIIIRFRLYSDQLAAGWGWAIDNLAIQDIVTEAENSLESSLYVYPNPANQQLVVEGSGVTSPKVSIQLLTLQGQLMFTRQILVVNGQLMDLLPTLTLPTGLYLVRISDSRQVVTKKISVSH
jgi:hypothetical protein